MSPAAVAHAAPLWALRNRPQQIWKRHIGSVLREQTRRSRPWREDSTERPRVWSRAAFRQCHLDQRKGRSGARLHPQPKAITADVTATTKGPIDRAERPAGWRENRHLTHLTPKSPAYMRIINGTF